MLGSPRFKTAAPLEAVDHEVLAGDEAGFRGGEEGHELGDVGGRAEAIQHDALFHLLAGRAGQAVAELGFDHAGADRVDHDLGAELLGKRARETQDAGLGGCIGMLADGAGDAAAERIERRMLAIRPPASCFSMTGATAWM